MPAPPPAHTAGRGLAGAVLRLVLAALVLGLSLRERAPGPPLPVVWIPPERAAVPPVDPRLEPLFAARMTPDDVARGAWALARGEGPGLSPEQRLALLDPAQRGQQGRVEVDRLRSERRALRDHLREGGATLAGALVQAGWRPDTQVSHGAPAPRASTPSGSPP